MIFALCHSNAFMCLSVLANKCTTQKITSSMCAALALRASSTSGCLLMTSRLPHLAQANRGRSQDSSSNDSKPWVVKAGRVSPQIASEEVARSGVAMPDYAISGRVDETAIPTSPPILDNEEQDRLRESCALASSILARVAELVRPGETTESIDDAVHSETVSSGAYPSQLNFDGFPKSVSASVNDVAVHGVPDDRPLRDGDVVSIDVTTYLHGFHGDCTRTFIVGERGDEQSRRLVNCALELLYHGISACGPGQPMTKLGHAVHRLAARRGVKVMPVVCGHGIGRHFHSPPDVYHVLNNYPGKMKPGMAFTVEPCVAEWDVRLIVPDNKMNVRTADGGRTAQFEHTVLITETGVEVLTERWGG